MRPRRQLPWIQPKLRSNPSTADWATWETGLLLLRQRAVGAYALTADRAIAPATATAPATLSTTTDTTALPTAAAAAASSLAPSAVAVAIFAGVVSATATSAHISIAADPKEL